MLFSLCTAGASPAQQRQAGWGAVQVTDAAVSALAGGPSCLQDLRITDCFLIGDAGAAPGPPLLSRPKANTATARVLGALISPPLRYCSQYARLALQASTSGHHQFRMIRPAARFPDTIRLRQLCCRAASGLSRLCTTERCVRHRHDVAPCPLLLDLARGFRPIAV